MLHFWTKDVSQEREFSDNFQTAQNFAGGYCASPPFPPTIPLAATEVC